MLFEISFQSISQPELKTNRTPSLDLHKCFLFTYSSRSAGLGSVTWGRQPGMLGFPGEARRGGDFWVVPGALPAQITTQSPLISFLFFLLFFNFQLISNLEQNPVGTTSELLVNICLKLLVDMVMRQNEQRSLRRSSLPAQCSGCALRVSPVSNTMLGDGTKDEGLK